MDQLMTLIQDKWMILAGGLVALFLVVKLVKTVMKWVIVLGIVAAMLFYGATYLDQIKEVSGSVVGDIKGNIAQEAVKALAGEDVTYQKNADGSFVISKNGVQLKSKVGSNEAEITIAGQSVTLKIDETLKALIEQVQQNAK